jgi:hypothetical protein
MKNILLVRVKRSSMSPEEYATLKRICGHSTRAFNPNCLLLRPQIHKFQFATGIILNKITNCSFNVMDNDLLSPNQVPDRNLFLKVYDLLALNKGYGLATLIVGYQFSRQFPTFFIDKKLGIKSDFVWQTGYHNQGLIIDCGTGKFELL